ncbi:unnamed protein product [Fraxinus pennsylvanica]|uniref:Ubiquitin carboxyl-terminal hydrolase n=1 Tax=Fraxinus pennsylvanica TaxID=56036 RepID=A0AAD1ZRG1_9LAMI|nr:unnamed protein product [Fraxinus pennsylvanica]
MSIGVLVSGLLFSLCCCEWVYFVRGYQFMEGSSNPGGNESVEELHTSTFTWRIENFSRLIVKKKYSETFVVGGYKWRILVFPKGNNNDCLSVYLDVADSAGLAYGWSRYAQFGLSVINQLHTRYTIRKDTQHNFNAQESDWGFTNFMPLTELYDPNRRYLVNDTCIIEANVSVCVTVSRPLYDSKKETGFVGFNSQGATCYLNSLLQTLYHLPYFRKAVCHSPTENNMPSGSITLALQNLFSELQSSDNTVTTKEFMEAFGWITYNSFPQHDVKEFFRTLFEKLEEKMKKLFEGHHMDFIECINVNYKSTRRGLFYDLQLDVKGCRDIYAALDKYVEEECLEGDNKYHAGSYGLQAVCHSPTENNMPSGSITLALQNLFSELQSSDNTVTTKEFMEAFGWITYNSFPQHDVKEFFRTLFEKLEEKMKKLFEGHHMDFIECINVNYKSTRRGLFYDLQLDVKGRRDIYAALDKYVEEECLKGDNKYHAGSYGLQDAKKGLLFNDFPPILQIHLKRFEYDFIRDTMVKLNDYFEFPLELDLDIEGGKYLSPEAERGDRNLYTLHSVLVHSGGVHGGHYSAFIRPNLSHQWYKFDDERVTKADAKEALEEQYGSKETNSGLDYQKCSNAYMLVYLRESEKEKIMCNENLQSEDGQKEQNKKDEEFLTVKVALDEDIKQNRDLDLVDHDKVKSFHIQRQTPFQLLKERVASEFGVPVKCQRFWIWAKHQSHTHRLIGPLTHVEEAQTIGQLTEASNNTFDKVLKLFLEVELGLDLLPIPPSDKTEDDILLFFKLYDPEREELRYVGKLFVKSASKPIDIFAKLNAMVGYAPDEEIELYEEMKFGANAVCERIEPNSTFQYNKLVDGNIVCFQRCLPFGYHLKYQYPDVHSFLEYKSNCLEKSLPILDERTGNQA